MQRKGVFHGKVHILNAWHCGRLTNSKSTEVHLHDIATILNTERDVEEHDTPPLINFGKWFHLKEKALDALRYRDMPLEYDRNGLEMAVAYLELQLCTVSVDDDFSSSLKMQSARLKKAEETRSRSNQIQSAGF
jgi:hypothetical protein